MQFAIFLLPASILAVGTFVTLLISGEKISDKRVLDWFVEALVFGVGLLIIPMVLVGVWLDGYLDQVVYIYFTISLFILSFYTFKLINSIGFIQRKFLLKSSEVKDSYNSLNLMQSSAKSHDSIFRLLIFLIVLSYTIINLVLPERGWDALHFYFPNALYYFYSDDIPTAFNPLNFIPAFKPPTNVLLLTYGFYVSKSFAAQLIPILFIIGMVFLCIHLAEQLHQSSTVGLLSALLVLTSPLMYTLGREYIYYQELSLTFFFGVSIIYLLKYLNANKTREKWYYGSIISVSLAVTVLSKISGITIFFVLITTFPLFSKKFDIYMKTLLFGFLSYFLFNKVARRTYIGTGIVVILIVLVILFNIYHQTAASESIFRFLLIGGLLSVIAIITWGIQLSNIPQIRQFLIDLYFNQDTSAFKYQYSPPISITEVFFEHAHSLTFVTSAFILLFSQQFNFFLFPFKLVGIWSLIKKKRWKQKLPLQWLFSFYILWLTYHSAVSSRYLSVILIPMSYVTAIGIINTLKYISNSALFSSETKNQTKYAFIELCILLALLGSNILMYYPIFPLEYVFLPFNERLYYFHTHWWKLIIYGLVAFCALMLFVKVIIYPNKLSKRIFRQDILIIDDNSRKLIVIILGMLLLLPLFTEGVIFAYSGFNEQTYSENTIYNNRKAVMDLAEYISSLERNIKYISVGVNIPGLEYFTGHPFLDLYLISKIENISNFFTESNITVLLQKFANNNIDLLITTLPANLLYPVYETRFVSKYPFLHQVPQLFNASYQNTEFAVYPVYNYAN